MAKHVEGGKHACLCVQEWHPVCAIVPVSGYNGVGVKLFCLDCRVLADAEAVSTGIVTSSSFQVLSGGEECGCTKKIIPQMTLMP